MVKGMSDYYDNGKKMYYYKKDSGLEIDFAIRYKNECVPLEIK